VPAIVRKIVRDPKATLFVEREPGIVAFLETRIPEQVATRRRRFIATAGAGEEERQQSEQKKPRKNV
jgi:hypothetical protein